jgi:hypothetical protein
MLSQKAIVFMISDFADAALERPLKRLALRHDVVAVTVDDPGERALPDVGLARFVDPETGETGRGGHERSGRAPRLRRTLATEREARQRAASPPRDRRGPVHTDEGTSSRCSALPTARDARRPVSARSTGAGTEPPTRADHARRATVPAPCAPRRSPASRSAGVGRRSRRGRPARLVSQGAAPGAPRVQLGVSVTPDTVTVGEPFVVQLRVQVPAGRPSRSRGADSGAAVAPLDPRRDTTRVDGATRDLLATYRLAAWDVGTLPIALGRSACGARRRDAQRRPGALAWSCVRCAGRQRAALPKPARPPMPDVGLWWLPVALAVLAASLSSRCSPG